MLLVRLNLLKGGGMKRVRLIEALKAHSDMLVQHLVDFSSNTVVALCKSDGTILAVNGAFRRLLSQGRDPSGSNLNEFLRDTDENGKYFNLELRDYEDVPFPVAGGRERTLFHCNSFSFPGGKRLFIGENLGTSDNEIIRTMSVLNSEMSEMARQLKKRNQELQRANETIEKLTRTDPLTGLANRRYFAERFESALSFARRSGQPLTVMMADLDHFKRVNDDYGHAAGDRVIKAFAECLSVNSRKEDLVTRYGVEEFIALMPNTRAFQGELFAERVRSTLADMDLLGNGNRLTASFGVAELAADDTGDGLLKRADEALYKAKENGRNQVVTAPLL
jgi:diguanylate cyclase (GGDEF)-like protein